MHWGTPTGLVVCLAMLPLSVLSFSTRPWLLRSAASTARRQGLRQGPNIRRLSLRASEGTEVEWPAAKVRSTFVDFFTSKHEHTPFPSSPVVPYDDPTLLFANAGMNQFKPIFLGQADPAGPLGGLKRAVNSQKCIRAGGKHNDLDDVGKDVYHHTYFEMLGSWSFGDYFKTEAIAMAWELLTETYGVDPDRLYASYFGGDPSQGLEPDREARDLWLQFLPADRVLPFGKADNFWEMGDVGPCGPCSEIHYDRIGGGRDASALVNADDPDVVEIWNLVFIQYNREGDGALKVLPSQHIDTGMGFERLVSVLQDKRSNYDTDVFEPLLAAIQTELDIAPYAGKIGDADADFKDTAYRVLADHLRTLSFAIADGATPSNEGRGYVLRRVLRRAVRYGQQVLGAEPGFFSKLIPVVVQTYAEAFPELEGAEARIVSIIEDEEAAFGTMLTRGVKHLEAIFDNLEAAKDKVVSGTEAFFLYDTLGFPVDLTTLMAEERGWQVDQAGFTTAMDRQRERSRSAGKGSGAGGGGVSLVLGAEQTAYLAKDLGLATTDDQAKYDWDLEADEATATVLAVYGGKDRGFLGAGEVAALGDRVGVVLDATPFYSEAGGQVADTGRLALSPSTGLFVDVDDVQAYAGYVVHMGTLTRADKGEEEEEEEAAAAAGSGGLAAGAAVTCRVDYARRRKVAPNHSMSHVLNHALQAVLGDEVAQKGSLVTPDKLRFDFSHNKALTVAQAAEVEAQVQAVVAAALPVHAKSVPLAEATEIYGLRAVFGETYPDPVRVVSVGATVEALVADPASPAWGANSVEFCGGTHVGNTGEAGAFVLAEESAVAKGIRRVVGLTGDAAAEARRLGDELCEAVDGAAALQGHALEDAVVSLRNQLAEVGPSIGLLARSEARGKIEAYSKAVASAKKAEASAAAAAALAGLKGRLAAALEDGPAFVVLAGVDLGSEDGKAAKKALDLIKKTQGDTPVLCLSPSPSGDKLLCFASCAEGAGDLAANEWVAAALAACGGRGGGRADAAQGQASLQGGEEAKAEAARVAAVDAAEAALGLAK